MKVWEVTISNENYNYWLFEGDSDEKYETYEWEGQKIDGWKTIEASISGDDFFDLMGERGISQVITNCRENICKEN